MKNFINISGFNLRQPNRGNAALNYGALSFLMQKGVVDDETELVAFHFHRNFFKALLKAPKRIDFFYENRKWHFTCYSVSAIERWLLCKWHFTFPWSTFRNVLSQTKMAVADFGGDGFSDIYGQRIFKSRFNQTEVTSAANIPLIVLPQTIGPFEKKENYEYAINVLKYAKEVYVRDDNFVNELNRNQISYTRTKDLSSYMVPEKWDIEIKDNAVGINVSGLAYFNKFNNLEGQFTNYPNLVIAIVEFFLKQNCIVYLIPHSYDYVRPGDDDDDILACRATYCKLNRDSRVIIVDKDLSAPQIKYVISQMSFFVGTRMHANFAAIYSQVPLFGLAYSKKFAGAFNANGLDGDKQTASINNISINNVEEILQKIAAFYKESVGNK